MGWEAIDRDGLPMSVYVAEPKADEPHSTIVVLQEIFGVNSQLRGVADRLAANGHRVLAPDIFYRQGARLVAGYDEVVLARQRKAKLEDESFLEDFRALLAWLRKRSAVELGVLGFCFGGRLAYLAACETDVARAVVFYGGGIAAGPVQKTTSIRCPMLLFFGAEDALIPPSDVQRIQAALKNNRISHELVVYPGAGHGFFCSERDDYRPQAAEDAWKRVLDFLPRGAPRE